MPRRRSWTDEELASAVAVAPNLHRVCESLALTPGARTYATLRRHIARLDLDAAHLPVAERPRRRRAWSDDDLGAAVAANTTVSGVIRALGREPSGGMHRYVRQAIVRLELDTSHFVGRGWARGRTGGGTRRPLEEILVERSDYTNSARLRERLVASGLREPRCAGCGLDTWRGRRLPLTLDHVNGDHADNRLDNLRILCPNCHAQTDTWCGRTTIEPA